MPPQIKQLIPHFVVLIAIFLVIRFLLIPDTYGNLGYFREISLEENAVKPVKYAGEEACIECHEDVMELKSIDVHETLSCESCHGPCADHVEQSGETPVFKPEGREFCGLCHSEIAARPTDVVFQVNLDEHNTDKDCINCHNPHQPWELQEEETPEEDF